jgi:hypothetical protein
MPRVAGDEPTDRGKFEEIASIMVDTGLAVAGVVHPIETMEASAEARS